jgi:hypothetical protein
MGFWAFCNHQIFEYPKNKKSKKATFDMDSIATRIEIVFLPNYAILKTTNNCNEIATAKQPIQPQNHFKESCIFVTAL